MRFLLGEIMKTLFCIMGRTASGKDSLVNNICKELNLSSVISYTTRPKRFDTENTHIFVDKQVLQKHMVENNIAAFTTIGEYAYWTTKEQITNCDIYIIDYEGLKSLRLKTPSNTRIVSIYIEAPEEDRIKRALLRQPNSEIIIQNRIANENEQFSILENLQDYQYKITNIHFIQALNELKQIVVAERNKNNEI